MAVPWQKSGNDDDGGENPRLFPPVTGKSTKEVAAGSALPGHAGMALWFFSYVASASCAGCAGLHLSRAGVDARVRFAAAVTGPSFPSAVIFRSFARSGFAAHPATPVSRVRQAAASLAPLLPACSPGFYGGTAPPGVAEY